MVYSFSWSAFSVFAFFVAVVLGLSFYLGRKAKSAKGYYAAHGEIHWFVNGIAFAGDYLSAASFLGICGMIAFYGYDGFLYSVGYLAGWIVALFVIAEPIKRLGKFTFADALDSRFNSRGIKLAVAISTLVVSIFYLIPQMVGAGALIKPLLGIRAEIGVLIVGFTVILIVVTAGMVSTTYVQFIKGSLLVIFCFVLTVMILRRGFTVPVNARDAIVVDSPLGDVTVRNADGTTTAYRPAPAPPGTTLRVTEVYLVKTQTLTSTPDGKVLVNGKEKSKENDLKPVGAVAALPGGKTETGPLGPFEFISTLQNSRIVTWSRQITKTPQGEMTTFYPVEKSGSDLLMPGASPTFAGVRSNSLFKKLDFLSLMLALFCGTASLPHILIRYYTVKDQASARKSTVIGIASIGFFYILTLYLGLGAMTSGALDPTDNNMSAPLLAKSFNNFLFAVISAIAFTTVLGTVSGLIMAGSGAVAHDLMENFLKVRMDDRLKVFYGKLAALALGILAMGLGMAFRQMNVTFLVGWAFNIAASANLPALVMLLFWKRTTKQGLTAGVTVGMLSSLAWILASPQVYRDVYGLDPARSIIPFSQPALVTIPLGFLVLVVVSLITFRAQTPAFEVIQRVEAQNP
ncbi:MAG TPA: cation acetate symporter [Tepidisphaeraceae bacterium]|nr:cation acetate symporter [Tepidisphaeraceae bacterium]